jgi:hypothetical protein
MEIDCFGGCPTCGKNDWYVNAGTTHVFFCAEHRVSWIFGANLFSSCHEETEQEQREKYKRIEGFERVEPLWADDTGMTDAEPFTLIEEAGVMPAFVGDPRKTWLPWFCGGCGADPIPPLH